MIKLDDDDTMRKLALNELKSETYDLVVVGGGIQGACLAWEGSLRGLKVALIDKGDFGAATSANSLKILHGGLRYLQSFDFKRMKESIESRRYFASIAPELVKPLPCVIPTQVIGLKNPLPMKVALLMNDIIASSRNDGLLPSVHLPNGSLLSKKKCAELFPGIEETFPTGGARWYDYLILNSERLTLELIKGAKARGATVLNYIEATEIGTKDGKVSHVTVRDIAGEEESESFTLNSKAVISSLGPWWNEQPTIEDQSNHRQHSNFESLKFAKAINIVLGKNLLKDHAIGLEAEDPNNAGKKRFFFLVPWEGGTMVGTTYAPDETQPDGLQISEVENSEILDSVRQWFPSANLSLDDIVLSHVGLLPIDVKNQKGEKGYKLHSDTIIQHHHEGVNGGIEGLFSVKTVKYTTSPIVAGNFFAEYGSMLGASDRAEPPKEGVVSSNHKQCSTKRNDSDALDDSIDSDFSTTVGDVLEYCREEFACKLLDVVNRRGVVTGGSKPSLALLRSISGVMAAELDWTEQQIEKEIEATRNYYEARGITLS